MPTRKDAPMDYKVEQEYKHQIAQRDGFILDLQDEIVHLKGGARTMEGRVEEGDAVNAELSSTLAGMNVRMKEMLATVEHKNVEGDRLLKNMMRSEPSGSAHSARLRVSLSAHASWRCSCTKNSNSRRLWRLT